MARQVYIPGEVPRTARGEAIRRRNDQRGIPGTESEMEWAYSPSTGAVGMRWTDGGWETLPPFRVPNLHYPMYGESESVTDWVSVGAARGRS